MPTSKKEVTHRNASKTASNHAASSVSLKSSDQLQKKSKHSSHGTIHRPFAYKAVGVWLVVYYIMMMIGRFPYRGIYAFLDTFWLCNINLLIAASGIALGNPALIGATVTSVFVAHVLWVVDVLTWWTFGFFPVGNAAYVAWPDTPWAEIITSTHHVWFIPLMLFVLHKNGGFVSRSYLISITFIAPVILVSLLFPEEVVLHTGQTYYMNVNMAHGWWKDVRNWPFSLIPYTNPHYLIFLHLFCVVKFSISYGFLRLLTAFMSSSK